MMNLYKNYFLKQTIWFVIGFFVLFLVFILHPKTLFKYSKYFYYFNLILLLLVLFFGKTINGSRAWFHLYFFSFQPSELMKFSLALYLSYTLSNEKDKKEYQVILKAFFITLIPSLLVFLEPDTGAVLIYFFIFLGVLVAYPIRKKWFFLFGIFIFLLLSSFLIFYYFQKDLFISLFGTSFFYRIDRILTFVNQDSFQLDRALITVGNAKFFHNGPIIYIPEAPTDFIIAFLIGNFGIFSFLLVLLCFFFLDIYFLIRFFQTHDKNEKLFLGGFIFMFLYAQIQNIGMNLGLLPIIGLPLPFLSYGGTNIIVYFLFLSIFIHKK